MSTKDNMGNDQSTVQSQGHGHGHGGHGHSHEHGPCGGHGHSHEDQTLKRYLLQLTNILENYKANPRHEVLFPLLIAIANHPANEGKYMHSSYLT